MAPKKQILVDDGPTELFTTAHAIEFETDYDLPPGSVTHAYQVRFGALAPYVLRELTDVCPTVDSQGNIIWPPVLTLKRRNATAGFSKRRQQEAFPSAQDPSDDDDEDLIISSPTPVGGPGLKRSNAIRRKRAIPSKSTPVPLQRRGAVRKSYNPVSSPTKRRGQRRFDGLSLSSPSSAVGSSESSPTVALRRSTRSGAGRGSYISSVPNQQISPKQASPKQASPKKKSQYTGSYRPDYYYT